MCLFFCYTDPFPSPGRFKLILIMNRDEYFDRTTSPAEWEDGILCGRDTFCEIHGGGTWCGMNKKGRIGILTNIFEGQGAKHLASRGSLVTDYLKGFKSPMDYMKDITSSGTLYKPYNLILMEQNAKTGSYELFYCAQGLNDRLLATRDGPRKLTNNHSCLGNHFLRRPFLKTMAMDEEIMEFIEEHNTVQNKENIIRNLYDIFGTRYSYFPDPEIEKLKYSDDFLMKNDKYIACPYITHSNYKGRSYGTRSQTIILIDYYDEVSYYETTRHFNPQTKEEHYSKVIEEFKLL
ncbi:transport and Golgi organization 2 homolog isoform X2 [Lepeophtheirus salmonis]|uniref:transport and Golgi organization 2 homolog isoform X2 n=1 Tax=Lepeophtheirus salmonis TaxID=72036 RepID=UPI001AE45398|nr:transport and Golgi organization 2 homolog isoform X2 [Lepeophtheirus salmonis]